MKKVEITKHIFDFASKTREIVKVLKAFIKGYEAFCDELHNSTYNEK